MRWPVVLAVLLLGLALSAEGKKKICPVDKVNTKQFQAYTETIKVKGKVKPVANQPCWFDMEKNKCGKCINGGQQCGAPMQKWCQSPKKKTGCPGIQQFKFTLSSSGYPCYWDPSDLSCAWCKPGNNAQCKDSKASDKCGRYCRPAKDQKCDGVPSTCGNIPKCGLEATCVKVGKKMQCKCNAGWEGNGLQCYNEDTGELAINPTDQVEMSIETDSKFWVYPQGSNLFPEL